MICHVAPNQPHFLVQYVHFWVRSLCQELIIQYQAKYEKDIECGGGYVKAGPRVGMESHWVEAIEDSEKNIEQNGGIITQWFHKLPISSNDI